MEQHRQRLLKVNLKEISNVPYRHQEIMARVIDVIDGDTVKVVILVGDHPLQLSIRLTGIDTPEMKPKPVVHVEEAVVANLIKTYVCTLVCKDQIIPIKLMSVDKYGGRYVGNIYIKDNVTLSDHLIAEGYAKRYNGKKKEVWTKHDLHTIQRKLEMKKK